MGQQQLLLLVLGIIIVGVAVMLGIHLFRSNSVDQKRDLLINEGLNVANHAIQYYRKPKILGGGEQSFADYEIPDRMLTSGNGSFTFVTSDEQVEIIGTGNELISGDDSIKVKFIITSNNIETIIIN